MRKLMMNNYCENIRKDNKIETKLKESLESEVDRVYQEEMIVQELNKLAFHQLMLY
jgi:hypothetical protein